MIEVTTAGVVDAFACLVFLTVGVLSWRGRVGRPVTAAALTAIAAGGFWWSLTMVINGAVTDGDVVAWARMSAFPGIGLTVGAFVVLAYAVGHPNWAPSRALLLALAVEPVVITVAAFTNRLHGWVYTWMYYGDLFPPGTQGPPDHNLRAWLFWVHTGYCYTLLTLGVVLVFIGWRRAPRVFRAQRLVLFVGTLPPFLINAVYLGGLVDFGTDPTIPAFALTGVILAYGVLRQDLLVLAPVARELILEQVGDAIIAVGPDGRILDLNPAAAELVRSADLTRAVGAQPTAVVGLPVDGLLGGALRRPELGRDSDDATEVTIGVHGEPRDLHTRWSDLVDRRGREIGSVLVLRDVTELNRQRRDLATANERLVSQLATIEGLRRDLAEQANRDSLTGLHNRRYVSAHLKPMLDAAGDPRGRLSVLMIDLDHFKAVNDRYGHGVGDAVLVAMAQTLGSMVPSRALAARWGGEEFLVVLPDASREQALAFGESLRTVMGSRVVEVGDDLISCTLSVGVATTTGDVTNMDRLVNAADMALYAAKASGRDRVVAASEDAALCG